MAIVLDDQPCSTALISKCLSFSVIQSRISMIFTLFDSDKFHWDVQSETKLQNELGSLIMAQLTHELLQVQDRYRGCTSM